jgi:hypothetical protein
MVLLCGFRAGHGGFGPQPDPEDILWRNMGIDHGERSHRQLRHSDAASFFFFNGKSLMK